MKEYFQNRPRVCLGQCLDQKLHCGASVYYGAYQLDVISYIIAIVMRISQQQPRRSALLIEGELARLAQELRHEIHVLKGALQGQSKQIEGLNFQWKTQAQELKALQRKNLQIELENKRLKGQIQQLVSSLSLLAKQKTEGHSVDHIQNSKQPPSNLFPSFHSQESLSKLSHSSSSHSVNPPKEQSGKFNIETRPTRENDEAHEQEDSDQDIIECVWDGSSGHSGKTDFFQEARYDPLNPHLKQFTVERRGNGVRIAKMSGESFFSPSHNFVHGHSLSRQAISRLRVKRLKVKDIFLLGVGSSVVLGRENSFKNAQLMAYSSNGDLWREGDSRRVGRGTRQDQTIQMIVDPLSGEIVWEVQGVVAAKATLPAGLLKKEVYFILVMFNKGDALEVQDSHVA